MSAQRHRAVHRVLGEGKRFDVERQGARKDRAVVVRLVAVAVDQDDVAGLQQRLFHHLVRRRSAVGHEEHVVRAERAGGLILRNLDVAGRFQQAVQPARGGRGLGEEEVHAVEGAHIPNPVRLEDGFAAGNREGMEGADRTLGVLLKIVEVRRAVAVQHAVEDAQVDFQRFLDLVEDPPDAFGRRIARGLFHRRGRSAGRCPVPDG